MTETAQVNGDGIVLKTSNLHRWLGKEENRVHALRGVSLSLEAGKIHAVVGPSGCGKSTLLYLLGLLDRPDEGDIWLHEKRMSAASEDQRTPFRNEHIGFVFQFHFLMPEFTAAENIMLPMRKLNRLSEKEMKERTRQILQDIDLEDKGDRLAYHLSGGEQQRVAVGRALANFPGLLLADEPTGNLDRKNSDSIFGLLCRLAREKDMAVLIVTHNLELARQCDRTFSLVDGSLISQPQFGYEGKKPSISYFICTTQRSGTHLLNEALRNTGLGGRPGEWLEPEFKTGRHPIVELLPDQPDKFLDYIFDKGMGPNGVFGCNVFSWSQRPFSKYINLLETIPHCEKAKGIDALKKIFPNLHFIHLTRRNRLRQAISVVKARQTDIFSKLKGIEKKYEKEPAYNYEEIKYWREYLDKSDIYWDGFFHGIGIEPFRVVYEDLVENYEETALVILDFLGIKHPPDLQFAPRYFLKQADHINDEWEQKFLAAEAESSIENFGP